MGRSGLHRDSAGTAVMVKRNFELHSGNKRGEPGHWETED